MSEYLNRGKWTCLRELIENGNSTQQRNGTFINWYNTTETGICFIINVNLNAQAVNSFCVSTDPLTFNSCHLDVGNGNEYPKNQYKLSTEQTKVYRDVLKFVHSNSEYSDGTLLDRNYFGSIFPFVYLILQNKNYILETVQLNWHLNMNSPFHG